MTPQAVIGSLSALLFALGTTLLLGIAPRLFGAESPLAKDSRLYDPPAGKLGKPGPDRRPIASITPQERQVVQGENAPFDGQRSRAPEGKIRVWSWRVDDRRLGLEPAVIIDTIELAPGSHRVILEITDDQGARATDEALLIVTAKGKKSDAAVTELEFLPENAVVRREVRLKALIANRGEETLRDVKVRFEAGGKLIAESSVRSLAPAESRPAQATWIPAAPGESRITVTVDPNNRLGDIDRSNNIQLRVIQIRPQPALAAIDPNPLEVTQGEQASFAAKVALPSGRASNDSLIHRWRGPAGRTGEDAVFRVDTADLQPGRYDIALEVTDRLGLKNRAQAILTVKLAPRAEVWLATPTGESETGDTLRFSGGTRPARTETQYKFIFADGKETEWLSRAEAEHHYEKPGAYSVQLIARRAGLVLGQTSKTINVMETAYTVMLKHDRAHARAGETLTFSAAVTPAAGNLEYQFDFGDKQQTAWSPNATATHSYARDGAYAVRAAIRVKATRVVQSAAAPITINPAATSWWPWLGIGAAILAAAGAVYRRWRATPLLAPGLAVVPTISLENLRVGAQGTVHSGCDIAIRASGGVYIHQIEAQGHLVGT